MNLFDVVPTLEKMTLDRFERMRLKHLVMKVVILFLQLFQQKKKHDESSATVSFSVHPVGLGRKYAEISPQVGGHFIFISMTMKIQAAKLQVRIK